MSLTMMGLTPDPLVRTILTLLLCVLAISVGSVSGLGSGVFAPTGVESKCDIFLSVMFLPKGVKF